MTSPYPAPHSGIASTGTLLHNMSAPPRTEIVLAPGRQVQMTRVGVPADLLTSSAQRGRRELFACRLARRLGLGRPRTRKRAEAVLETATKEALEQARVAGAAVYTHEFTGFDRVANPPGQDHAGRTSQRGTGLPEPSPLLALAIISRCSGNLFLRDRCPRFDHPHLQKKVHFYRGNEPWRPPEVDSKTRTEPQKTLEADDDPGSGAWETYAFRAEAEW